MSRARRLLAERACFSRSRRVCNGNICFLGGRGQGEGEGGQDGSLLHIKSARRVINECCSPPRHAMPLVRATFGLARRSIKGERRTLIKVYGGDWTWNGVPDESSFSFDMMANFAPNFSRQKPICLQECLH